MTRAEEQLANLKIFRGMTAEERNQILELTEPVEVAKGEQIITQGHQKQNLWFIIDGSCQITRRTEKGCQSNLAELGPQTHFGEMSFFHAAPHSADVVALTPMKLLRFTRGAFEQLASERNSVALKLVLNCVDELASRLRRTDKWITELECREKQPLPSEWTVFRELIFKG